MAFNSDFRKRLLSGEALLGSFVKTPTTHSTEILASVGFDFVIVDAEHAALDRPQIDMIALAGHATGIATLVRVPEPSAAAILGCLDVGVSGILAPHVDSAERAHDVAKACRYLEGGTRGYSTNTRSGYWGGTTTDRHTHAEDERVACVAMIEDQSALANLDEILAVPGIDAVFVGRADLTVSMGLTDSTDPQVADAVDAILNAARAAKKPGIALSPNPPDAAQMRDKGASAIVVSSDQGFLRSAALQARKEFQTNQDH